MIRQKPTNQHTHTMFTQLIPFFLPTVQNPASSDKKKDQTYFWYFFLALLLFLCERGGKWRLIRRKTVGGPRIKWQYLDKRIVYSSFSLSCRGSIPKRMRSSQIKRRGGGLNNNKRKGSCDTSGMLFCWPISTNVCARPINSQRKKRSEIS